MMVVMMVIPIVMIKIQDNEKVMRKTLKLRFLFTCAGLHFIEVQYLTVAFVILLNFPLQGFINLKVRTFASKEAILRKVSCLWQATAFNGLLLWQI